MYTKHGTYAIVYKQFSLLCISLRPNKKKIKCVLGNCLKILGRVGVHFFLEKI